MRTEHYYCGKRKLDFFLSLLALVLLLPLFLLIAWGILISSGRPIIYRHRVVGKGGEFFLMFKFRTMLVGTDCLQKKIYQQNNHQRPKNDPRVTRFGRLLRRTSLDELPQLMNILRGQMSLVGPRPLTGWENQLLNQEHRQLRQSMRPGLTGPIQLNLRSRWPADPNLAKRLQIDYAKNCSLKLDIQIILRSIKIVFIPNKDAY